jgi:hypothetical protein
LSCGRCRHFVTDAVEIERELPGLLALGSAGGDSWGDQGLCRLLARMLDPSMSCPRFEETEQRAR